MWVALGPFDGEAGDASFQKPKLLKPNHSYTVGRKDRPLLINNKKVSHDHCDFIVGDHTVDDVSNPSAIPTLELLNHNKKDKVMLITRGANNVEAYPSTKEQLQHGDIVSLISGVVITVEWRPLHAYSPLPRSKVPISLEDCASLGIKLLYIPHPEITHHLAAQYTANLITATSLLTLSKFVKPEWLQDVIRLGNLPRNNEQATGTSLEDHCVLPLESKFRPVYSPSLLQPQKKFGLWEPNEERVNLFHTCRFICLQEKPTDLDSAIRETIHRGGGTLEIFDIHSGIPKFHRALTRSQAKEGKKTVVLGDTDLMQTAVGQNTWAQFVAESESFALEILSPSKLVQAVLDANVELLFSSNAMNVDGEPRVPSPLPEVVPNSFPEEPSIEASAPSSQITGPPRRKLVRRVTSRPASVEPSAAPSSVAPSSADLIGSLDEEIPLRPRKPLTRRVAGGKAVVTGLDDPSGILDEIPGISDLRKTPPPPPVFDLAAPTPARSSRLKRRIGVSGPDALPPHDSQAFSSSGLGETISEPPLKKFKALFEATNTDESQAQTFDLLDSLPTETQTQNETQSRASGRPLRGMVSSLAILREEEEESQDPTTATRGLKRRMEFVDEDVEMQTVDHELIPSPSEAGGPPPAKKRALDSLNAVERTANVIPPGAAPTSNNKPPSKPPFTAAPPAKEKINGAPAGKPDTDAAFLKAIASTKRGKKTEDAFDREFNNLKISKPELVDNPDPEQEWAVLAEFGDDSGLRGNFMTVVEMDLYRKDDDPARRKTTNHSWDGKPNFKKFKKKINGLARPNVDLFISDENDYGMGPAYWNSKNTQRSQTQTQIPLVESQNDESQLYSQPQHHPRAKLKSRPLPESEDDHEEPPPPIRQTRKAPSRAGSAAPSKKTPTTSKNKTSAKAALFIHSDDDDIEVLDGRKSPSPVAEHLFDEEETLQSSAEVKPPPGRRSTRTAKAPAKAKKTLVVEDDSDDDAVFQGFKGKKGGR